MFPAGISNSDAQQLVTCEEARKLAKALDRPVVLMLALGSYSIYWCQTLSSVMLRPRNEAKQTGFDKALREAIEACLDSSVQALVLDFRENQQLRYPLSTEELGLEDFGRHIVAVHPQYGENGFHDEVHLYGFSDLKQATRWLQVNNRPAQAGYGAMFRLSSGYDAALVAANYSGCVYWLKSTMTMVMLYSGQELDDRPAAALWVAMSEFLEHLRATALIIDVRHLVNMHRGLLQETSTAIQYLKARGAEKFVLVGAKSIKPSGDDPVEAHTELLAHTQLGVQVVKNLDQALNLVANPKRRRTLNS